MMKDTNGNEVMLHISAGRYSRDCGNFEGLFNALRDIAGASEMVGKPVDVDVYRYIMWNGEEEKELMYSLSTKVERETAKDGSVYTTIEGVSGAKNFRVLFCEGFGDGKFEMTFTVDIDCVKEVK